jgi:hypothetical protein
MIVGEGILMSAGLSTDTAYIELELGAIGAISNVPADREANTELLDEYTESLRS